MLAVRFGGVIVVLALVLAAGDSRVVQDAFDERLLVRPLPDRTVLIDFQFDISSDSVAHAEGGDHYILFPKSIGQMVTKYGLQSMSLFLTQGRWFDNQWGPALRPAAPGAELTATFRPNNRSVSVRWLGIQQTLAGLFCSSLQQIGERHSTNPPPIGSEQSSAYHLSGSLPRESVCTENTTPWAKLLPCNLMAGIARQIDTEHLHDTSYHSVGLEVFQQRDSEHTWVARFSLSVVVDPSYLSASRSPRWSLPNLLHPQANLPGISCCALSSRCVVHLDDRYVAMGHSLSANHAYTSKKDSIREFDISSLSPLIISFEQDTGSVKHEPSTLIDAFPELSNLVVHRYLTGRGLHMGGITTFIHNKDKYRTLQLSYFDAIPWFLRVYFHTFHVRLNDQELFDPLRNATFRPSGSGASTVFFQTEIPPLSTLTISVQSDKIFLPMKEYPPDVSRGFEIPVSLIRVRPTDGSEPWRRVIPDVISVMLPGPDMSMPFNVIAFTSTLLAFFFGTMFNVLYRHPIDFARRSRGGLFVRIVRAVIARVRRRAA